MGARSGWFQSDRDASEFRAPLTLAGGEVAGAEVVRELPAAFALPVWQALRCVLRWAAAEPGARAALFDADEMVAWEVELLEAAWDEGARLPAAVIAGALADPARADAERVARACLCLCDWALAQGAVSTGLAFAEAAALAWPEQPRFAYAAGRLLRAHGRPREAEAWMRRVVRVGRMLGDWSVQALGLNSLGNTFTQMGDFRKAIQIHRRALSISRRRHLDTLEGEILHDLFVATWHAGDVDGAEDFARAAFECYRHGHERLPALAHDIAFSWIVKGYHTRALSILEALPDYFSRGHERVRVFASTARAAGGCGDRPAFERAVHEVVTIVVEPLTTKEIASPLVDVAVGAIEFGAWEIGESMLTRALEIAREYDEQNIVIRAEETLAELRSQQRTRSRPAPERVSVPGVVDALAMDLRQSLQHPEATFSGGVLR